MIIETSVNRSIWTSNEAFRKKFIAMVIGNMMEWFDFASFGALADVIGEQFFPKSNPTLELLKSLSIFGAAFVMRPLGGVFIGYIGDSMGRKRALELSIGLMLIPSFLIGVLPSYHQWGWITTVFLVILRLTQGLACGGEIVGAFIYTVEATNGVHRGYWGGCCKASGNLGSSIGLGIVAILRSTLSNDSLLRWGWRIPFLLSVVFGTIGMRLRSSLTEDSFTIQYKKAILPSQFLSQRQYFTPNPNPNLNPNEYEYEYQSAISNHPIALTEKSSKQIRDYRNQSSQHSNMKLINYWREILLILFVAAYWGVCYYSCFVWMMYFMSKQQLIGGDKTQNISDDDIRSVIPYAWTINFSMNLGLVLMLPLGGYLGDWLGTFYKSIKTVKMKDKDVEDRAFQLTMCGSLILGISIMLPAFAFICTRTVAGAVIGQGMIMITIGLFGGNLPAFMVGQFEKLMCYKGVGIGYNIAHALFSGTAPLIQTALVMSSKSPVANYPPQSINRPLIFDWSHDGRLRPAMYIMAVGTVSLIALLFGAPYCKRCRENQLSTKEITEFMLDDQVKVSESITPSAPFYYEVNEHDLVKQLPQNQQEVKFYPLPRRYVSTITTINEAGLITVIGQPLQQETKPSYPIQIFESNGMKQ